MSEAVMGIGTWWDAAATDWSQDDPAKAVHLFERTYPNVDDVRQIARAVGLSWDGSATSALAAWRAVFAAAAEAESHGPLELAAYMLFDDAPAPLAHREPLIRLLGDRLPYAHAVGAMRYGRAAVPRPAAGLPQEPLEALSSRVAGFADGDAYSRALEDHRRRTALLRRGHDAVGTGVLIGPDLLLTAAHVLRYDGWPPPEPLEMWAVFDFASRGRSRSEAGVEVEIAELVYGLPPMDAERQGRVSRGTSAPKSHLDFAVVRLREPLGDEPRNDPRGYYQLDTIEYAFAGRPLRIAHHPAGAMAIISDVIGTVTPTADRSRIDYQTNTLPGSSGGPIVDTEGRLVGIHHLGPPRDFQRGVPFSAISEALLASEHASLFTPRAQGRHRRAGGRRSPFMATMLAGDPFVDREALRDGVQGMVAANGKRHLAIPGATELGKSHSMVFLTLVAAESPNWEELLDVAAGGMNTIVVDLRDFDSLPLDRLLPEVGKALLEQAELWTDADEAAQSPRQAVSIAARLRSKIRKSNQQWWVCFDSIDRPEWLIQGRLHELINAVAGLTRDLQVQIRVVLGGQRVREFLQEPATNMPWIPNEVEATPISRAHMANWVRLRAQEDGRLLPFDDLEVRLTDFVKDRLELSAAEVAVFEHDGWPPRDVAGVLPAFLATVYEGSNR